MKFNELTQYMIEVNGVVEIRDLPVQEEKPIEQVFEPCPPVKLEPTLEERVLTVEQEQEVIINTLAEVVGVTV